MSITIQLPPATEEWARAEAEAAGMDIGAFIAEAVEARRSLAQLSFRDILGPVHDDFRQSGMSESGLDSLLAEELSRSRSERKSRSGISG